MLKNALRYVSSAHSISLRNARVQNGFFLGLTRNRKICIPLRHSAGEYRDFMNTSRVKIECLELA